MCKTTPKVLYKNQPKVLNSYNIEPYQITLNG